MRLRVNFIENAPVADSSTERSVRPFEKFHVAPAWIGAHVLKHIVDVLKISARDIAKIADGGLIPNPRRGDSLGFPNR
jgi:hypothetical protein